MKKKNSVQKRPLFQPVLLIMTLFLLLSVSLCPVPAFASEQQTYFDTSVFTGKKVAIQAGTFYVQAAKDYISDPEPYYFDNVADMITSLLNGKTDVALNDYPPLAYAASQKEGLKSVIISEEGDEIAFGAAKTEQGQKYIDELNEFIAAKKSDGTLKALQDKWIDGNSETRVMEDYSNLPSPNGVLKVASDVPFPPFEYEDNGIIVGYEIELLVLFAKEYGYGIDLTPMAFSSVLAGVAGGKFDIGASALSITEERKESLLFSDSTYTCYTGICFIQEETAEGQSFWQNLKDSFTKTFITENRWMDFLSGIKVTMNITLVSILAGTVLGLIFHLICRRGKKFPNLIAGGFRYIVKGLPVVVLLMVLYYLIFKNSDLSEEWIAIIGFTVIFTCSMHELLQGAEMAVDKGQAIAARALGYGEVRAYWEIIFPQAARHFWGPFKSEVTAHIKATAVVGYITVVDLTRVGDLIRGKTYDAFFPLIAVAVIYFILAAFLNLFIRILARLTDPEKRTVKKIMKGVQAHD